MTEPAPSFAASDVRSKRIPKGEVVRMTALPECDMEHRKPKPPARFDARTYRGAWAFMCRTHYLAYRMHTTLGVGKAQYIITRTETEPTPEALLKEITE